MIPTREELCQTLSHAGQLWTRPSQLQTHARATGGMPMFRQFFLGLRSAQTRFLFTPGQFLNVPLLLPITILLVYYIDY